jgi:hypothetical protein
MELRERNRRLEKKENLHNEELMHDSCGTYGGHNKYIQSSGAEIK